MANFNFNKLIIGGRLTADPELKTTPAGIMVTSFTVAVNRKAKDNETTADFFNVTAWKNTAEFITKYFHKGSSICIVGTLRNRNWTDNNGTKHYATDIIADEALFVDGKNDNTTESTSNPSYSDKPHFEEISDDEDLPF